ncbi:MAG: glycosyltransferase family 2 protein [Pseudomonadota bacterium]
MVYRDHWALSQWYAHYSRHLGAENLFVIAHGADPEIQRICPHASVITIPRDELEHFDLTRGRIMNAFQTGLDEVYDWVIRTDADELICFDPTQYSSFADVFHGRTEFALFALGLELAEQSDEPELKPGMSALKHRSRAKFSSHYSKAWAVRRRIGLRRHGVEVRPRFAGSFRFLLPTGVYLVHLKYANSKALAEANAVREEIAQTAGEGLPGRAWQNADATARKFRKRLEQLPLTPWEIAEPEAYAKLSTNPVRDPDKGVVRVRNILARAAVDLPEWFRDA